MKTITAVLIDPVAKTLATVQWDQELDSIYKLLGCEFVEAHNILTLGDPVTVWCDEEFWMRKTPDGERYPATVLVGTQPIAGRILLTGESDGKDGALDCPIAVQDLKDLVKFGTMAHPFSKR